MITIVHAVLLSVFHTVSYVGVLYISPSTRPSAGSTRATHRDDPEIIRYRVRAATIATLLSLILTSSFIYLADSKNKTWHDVLTLMGIYPTIGTIIDIFKTLLLVMILFTGRIFERYYIDDGWSNIPDEIHSYIHTWAGWRNIIAGPLTEEIVFRSCIVPLHLIGGDTPTTVVWTTPLYFGIAHLHHLYEFALNNPHRLTLGIIRSLFQFTYTTVFGWLATFIYIRTGSVWTAFVAHAFCNMMGLPSFGRVSEKERVNVAHWVLLVLGTVGFFRWYWVLTESRNRMAGFY